MITWVGVINSSKHKAQWLHSEAANHSGELNQGPFLTWSPAALGTLTSTSSSGKAWREKR